MKEILVLDKSVWVGKHPRWGEIVYDKSCQNLVEDDQVRLFVLSRKSSHLFNKKKVKEETSEESAESEESVESVESAESEESEESVESVESVESESSKTSESEGKNKKSNKREVVHDDNTTEEIRIKKEKLKELQKKQINLYILIFERLLQKIKK